MRKISLFAIVIILEPVAQIPEQSFMVAHQSGGRPILVYW
jgi:hypothetical protein